MAATGFTCLLILLLFASCLSMARVIPDKRLNSFSTEEKGILEGDIGIGGRKVAAGGVMRLEVNVNGGALGQKKSRLSVANRQCGQKKAMKAMNENCKQPAKRFSEEVDDGGFVAFNADYHAPRHHPPKNN